MKWLLIALICGFCYGMPYWLTKIIPETAQTLKVWWYPFQIMWSVLIIFLVLDVESSKLTYAITAIECLAILTLVFACFGYINGKTSWFYLNDFNVLTKLAIAEGLVLLGSGGYGLFNYLFARYGRFINGGTGYRRNMAYSKIFTRKVQKKC